MKYFIDTEFIESGIGIDLISIGIVAEDSRSLYLQNADCKFQLANEWVWRNVFPHLAHFSIRGMRNCQQQHKDSGLSVTSQCYDKECPWRWRSEIRDAILEFCSQEKHGKPEFWGYYADYDWVAFCQLFGSMAELPKGYPMYCRDIKQWCDMIGNPKLPEQGKDEHSAISDARWNSRAWEFLKEHPTLQDRQQEIEAK